MYINKSRKLTLKQRRDPAAARSDVCLLRSGRGGGCFCEPRMVTGNYRREGLIDGMTGGAWRQVKSPRPNDVAWTMRKRTGHKERYTGHTLPGLHFANAAGKSSCSQAPSV